jgi:hypothetical protein
MASAVPLGTADGRVLAQLDASLKVEFEKVAQEYEVPVELLLAMGYGKALWEMPPATASAYDPGELDGRGASGIGFLARGSRNY